MGRDFVFDKEQRRKIEIINLIIYSIYGMGMTFLVTRNHWPTWIILFIFALMLVGWSMYLGKVKTYKIRTFIVAAMMNISIFIYSTMVDNIQIVFAPLVAVIIVMGLYGVPSMIYLSLASSTGLLLVHLFVLKTIAFDNEILVLRFFFQVLAIYIAQFVVYYFEKQHLFIQEKMEDTIQELQTAQKSKDDFLANVSHELRTPISTISGISELLLKKDLNSSMKADVFQMQMAGRNLHSIVSDIFDFYELSYGELELVEEDYNMSSTIHDIVDTSMAKKVNNNVELVVDCDATLPIGLIGDELKLRRAVLNIIDNAIKFTEYGCVSVSFSHRKEEYGINLCICVRDTGIGMTKEELEKISNSYFQADSNRNRQKGGIGLGLAISQALIHKMGGYISIESEYGRGTAVTIVVPQKVSNTQPVAVINDPKQLKILCYVDLEIFELSSIRDEYNRSIQKLVVENGISFHMCKNMAELMRRVEKEKYTHIFLGLAEYDENRKYYDDLSKKTEVILVLNPMDEKDVVNSPLKILYKPFYILPVAQILNGESTTVGKEDGEKYKGKFIAPQARILAVDDNEINLMVLKGLLEPYQVQLVTATSGQEALDLVVDKNFDIVFMDHMMPEMDGIETFKRIKEMPETYFKNLPVIALTANAIAGARKMFINEGFYDFISKPIETSVMDRVLFRSLPKEKIQVVQDSAKQDNTKTVSAEVKEKADSNLKFPSIIDYQLGLTYCGSEDNLSEMIQLNCQKYPELSRKVFTCYDLSNWKEYVIHVHGLKSSLLSIGLKKLSEKAKSLEQAGKNQDLEYIYQNHDSFMEMYQEQMREIADFYHLTPEESVVEDVPQIDISSYTEITVEELEQFVQDFESIVYTFSEHQMLELLHTMDEKRYKNHVISEELKPVMKKVTMSDYMSAFDYLVKWKNNIK